MNKNNKEIEVRFLEINKKRLIENLEKFGAKDLGEDLLEEIIFYDKDYIWRDKENKFVRLRKSKSEILLSYKHHKHESVDGVQEIEFGITDKKRAESFLKKIGLVAYRYQQKKRHSFLFNGVHVDIDTWPHVPTYVEFEGDSVKIIKKAVKVLGLDWNSVVFKSARTIIEDYYNIPVGAMKWFTFDKFK